MDAYFEISMIILLVIFFHFLIYKWITRKSKNIDGK